MTDTGLGTRLKHLVVGGAAGAVATVVMTVYRMSIARSLPPTAAFWSKFVDSEGSNVGPALGLHLLYGAGAGAVFGVGVGPRLSGSDVNRERLGTLLGILYGLGLSVFGRWVLVELLLGLDLDPDERFVFHAGHAIYGQTLGNWFGSYE